MTAPSHTAVKEALSTDEAQLLWGLSQALQTALRQGCRQERHRATQAIVRAAWQEHHRPPLRQALRRLSWFLLTWRINPSMVGQGFTQTIVPERPRRPE